MRGAPAVLAVLGLGLIVALVIGLTAGRDHGLVCGPGTHVELPPSSPYSLPRSCVPGPPR